ncbi:MAG: hypothetical protein AAF572_22110 [Cyanobacteria bacterium P01_B01_bin.77]
MTSKTLQTTSLKASKVTSKYFNFLTKNKKLFSEDPNFFWMQYLARFQFIREWSTRDNFAPETTGANTLRSISLDDSLEDAHKILWNYGYYRGIRLAPAILEEVIEFSRTYPCYGDRDPNIKMTIDQREQVEAELGRTFKLASYFDGHESCKAFQQLKQDPTLKAIAAHYLGHEPKYHRGELMWSFPRVLTVEEKIASAQVLHCDINDYKTVKFFFYITDVDMESGPHVYIKGSHHNRSLWHQMIGQSIAGIPDADLIERYGPENVATALGPAGFGFVGDPYVLHRGSTPSKRPRLLLQLEFGMNTYKTWYFVTPK